MCAIWQSKYAWVAQTCSSSLLCVSCNLFWEFDLLFVDGQALLVGRSKNCNPRQCLRVELARKQTMMYYQPQRDRLFLRVVLALPTIVTACKRESLRLLRVC
jgi:hypothetical protein